MVIILYLLDRNVQTVKWNGQPLHEAKKAEVEEVINVSYTLKVDYPITDTEIYKKFQEDMLIIAPTPITGRQLFRIKEISEQDDTVNLTCQHITEDIFKRSVRPIKVSNSTCQIALNAMISAVKTPLGKFSFTSNIMDNRTFNTTEDETLYKILMDGKHSIVGAWEGEMIRDNFLIDIPKSRGIDRGVVITTHQNLKQYERNKSSSSIITRLHLKSTFKPEGAEEDTVLKVTVDSPLIGNYPYINEAEYENNDLTTEEELRKWGEAKFKNGDIDKSTDQIKVEAYELDGQTVHLGDTVTIMSLKHDVMLKKKTVGYVYDALSEEYISLTFDDKAGHGGGMSGSNGISDVASEILDTVQKTQEDDEYYKKLKVLVDNANRAFEDKAGALEKEITDGIEQAKAQAEVVKEEISAQVTEKIAAANQANKNEIVEEFKAQYNGIEVEMQGLKATTDRLKTSDADIQKLVDDFKAQTQSQFVGIKGAQSRFEQTTEKAISDLTNVANGKADRSYVEQTVNGIKEEFTSLKVGSRNYAEDYDFTRGLWFFAHGDSSNSTGTAENGVYTISGSTNTWKQAQLFSSTAPSWATTKTTALDYLEKGEPYTLSFYAKRNRGSGTMWVSLRENRKSGGNRERISAQFQLTDDWQLYKVSVPALEKSDEFDYWRIIIGYSEAGSISFKKVELTQSTTRTDAGPAPEDQNYQIEQAQATFEKTVQGLSTQLTKLETKTGPNGELEQRMLTYSEKAAVDAVKATRQILEQGYVAKSQYTEDVAGINRKFESISTSTDSKISSKLAEFKQGIDGQFSTFSTEFGMRLSSQNSVLNDKLDDFKDSINGRFANYQSTVDGQVTTIVSQFDGVLKKTDINITDGQISFGTGKTINGRTISSLLVQEPEAIALIAKLIKVKGDMVVDGSITSRHLASQSVRTGHMESGSVTTQILASNAVTADKLLVDSAMINKLVSNQAFIRELTSQKAFITQLGSIDFTAEHIKGGRLSANNGTTVFDLSDGTLNLYSNTGTIRRIDDTSSSQFMKMTKSGFVAEQFRDSNAAMIVIGTNHDKSEKTDNETFAGTRLWSGSKNGVKESFYEIIGDRLAIYSNGDYRSPWVFHNNTRDGSAYFMPMNEKGVRHNLGREDRHFSGAWINNIFIGQSAVNLGTYVWDILTCFGQLSKYNWDFKDKTVSRHISGVLTKYGFK
ncbi:phage tail spike protein [Streptococcus sp. HMSC065C01]|uniref:phage tail spike protein n=1 Tax=Streptococcus sp. HMSC065C01 TaxID=1739422 RepID=UPI000A8FF823|nr:phage tail spike protein [Streptococcus sp. HMSC065C01]